MSQNKTEEIAIGIAINILEKIHSTNMAILDTIEQEIIKLKEQQEKKK